MSPNLSRRPDVAAAAVYLPLALLAATAFAVTAASQGRVSAPVVVAGAFWVGLLTLIVAMPLIIPAVRRHYRTS